MSLNIKIQDGRNLPIPFCSVLSHITQIQDGHQWPYWKFNSKEKSPGNEYNITFPINYFTQSPFMALFMYFDRSECQNSRWSQSVISIVFRFKPYDPFFLLNVTSETRFKQYLLIPCAAFAHISTMITKKSRDEYFFKRKSIISSSIPLNWCHKMNCNDNDWCCKFINFNNYFCLLWFYMSMYHFWLIC